MQNLTATQDLLLAEAAEAMLIHQMYVQREAQQVHPATDRALCKAIISAESAALAADVPQARIDAAFNAADAEAILLIRGL